MIRNRLLSAVLVIAGLAAVQSAIASPVVIVNGTCTITPTSSSVFTISTEGNVLINGSYGTGCTVGSGSGTPTFSFNPNPADLSVLPSSLPSTGGTVTPAFTSYNASSCTGKVTATAGCPAIPAPWGTGGVVCSGQTNLQGQTYCSPTATINVPANTTGTACTYTFQATACGMPGGTSVNSQNATLSVNFGSNNNITCNTTDPSDIGYARQCSGSATNYHGTVAWDNTYKTLMGGDWPGNAGASGHTWGVTVNASQYASFQINTGSAVAGVQFTTQNSTSPYSGLLSVSTTPGDFFGGTSVCTAPNSTISISSKAGTLAQCKLALNSTYYLNISAASYFADQSGNHITTCGSSACTLSWGFQGYTN